MKQIKTEIEELSGTANPCEEIVGVESSCLLKSDIICADCKKCYTSCKSNFPEEYITGGAEQCKDFEIEEDSQVIEENLKKKEKEIVDKYAERGFAV